MLKIPTMAKNYQVGSLLQQQQIIVSTFPVMICVDYFSMLLIHSAAVLLLSQLLLQLVVHGPHGVTTFTTLIVKVSIKVIRVNGYLLCKVKATTSKDIIFNTLVENISQFLLKLSYHQAISIIILNKMFRFNNLP